MAEPCTVACYKTGCRCVGCRQAKSNLDRSWRQTRPLSAGYITARVKVDDAGCWIWQGRVDAWGYGKDCRGLPAHRTAYLAFGGVIGEGLALDHLCRVRPCCNPAHLEPVTHKENTRRSRAFAAAQRAG